MEEIKNGKTNEFIAGVKDAVPIAAGYFAVSFSLGIAAHNIEMNAMQGFFLSLLNNASAGEYAGINAMKTGASLGTLAVLIMITNARYLLMSCALSQKISPRVGLGQRFLIAFGITDELFALGVSRKGYTKPSYLYGAYICALSCWASGTTAGVIAGNVFSQAAVTALSASIYGMFLAIFMPAARKERSVLLVVLSGFALSSLFSFTPVLNSLSESMKVIILTLGISFAAAILKPVPIEVEEETARTDKNEFSERKPSEKKTVSREEAVNTVLEQLSEIKGEIA